MKKVFDSALILLCWQRVGVPLPITQWLVDRKWPATRLFGSLRPGTALEQWDTHGLDGAKDIAFNPERGTGQGDIHSPFT